MSKIPTATATPATTSAPHGRSSMLPATTQTLLSMTARRSPRESTVVALPGQAAAKPLWSPAIQSSAQAPLLSEPTLVRTSVVQGRQVVVRDVLGGSGRFKKTTTRYRK